MRHRSVQRGSVQADVDYDKSKGLRVARSRKPGRESPSACAELFSEGHCEREPSAGPKAWRMPSQRRRKRGGSRDCESDFERYSGTCRLPVLWRCAWQLFG